MDAVTWASADAVDEHYARLLAELDRQRQAWGNTDRIKRETALIERARASEKKEAARA